jgi:hypothetical protein
MVLPLVLRIKSGLQERLMAQVHLLAVPEKSGKFWGDGLQRSYECGRGKGTLHKDSLILVLLFTWSGAHATLRRGRLQSGLAKQICG